MLGSLQEVPAASSQVRVTLASEKYTTISYGGG
jgi:hypothetical protein